MLEVRLIGTFQVLCDGNPVVISSRAAQSLFAYLILTAGTQHRREKLAGMFWPDASEQKARAYLRHELWRIRKAISTTSKVDSLLADDISISFNASADYSLDVATFVGRSETESIEDLKRALAVFESEFLPGFYDEWIVLEREHLLAVHEQKIARLLELLEGEKRWREIQQWAEHWISFGQGSEAPYRFLMIAYEALGDHVRVTATYERCRNALRALDLEPSEQTRQLAFKRAARLNIPIPLTSFVGREKELKEVADLLARSRLVTLTGSGGVGKTRLAIQAAAEVIVKFPDGVWFLDLARLSDPALVPSAAMKLLGLRESGEIPDTDLLTAHLRFRTALFIFDNCEHLINSCADLIFSLLTSCANVSVLATSRESLRVSGEIPYRVPSLEVFQPEKESSPDQLLTIESVRLFIERAQYASLDFVANSQSVPIVAQICRRLDGIPLAIELAAARTNMLSVQQISTRLDDRFNLLTRGLRTNLPRHQTLQATIDWSYDLLSEEERTLFRRLAVFMGGWTLEAAEAVCSDGEIIDILAHLVDKSLVGVDHEYGEARYYFLETIRQYAKKKLIETELASRVYGKHLNYFVDWVEILSSMHEHSEPGKWMDHLLLEHNNLQIALKSALSTDVNQGIRLIVYLAGFWFNSGFWSEGLQWCRHFLASPETLAHTPHLVRAMARASFLALANKELADALVWSKASLRLGKKINDQSGIAQAYSVMARIHPLGSKKSRIQLRHSLEIAKLIEDHSLIAYDLNMLGMMELFDGQPRLACNHFIESLNVARTNNLRSRIFWPSANLGILAFQDLDFDLANISFNTALTAAREQRNKDAQAWMLSALAQLALRQGNPDLALSYLNEAKRICYEFSENDWIESSYGLQEAIYLIWTSQEYDRAFQICWQCYQCVKNTGDKIIKCEIIWILMEWSIASGQTELGVRLAGTIEGGDPYFGKPMYQLYRVDIERNLFSARQKIDESTIASLMADGRAMTVDDAITYAFEGLK